MAAISMTGPLHGNYMCHSSSVKCYGPEIQPPGPYIQGKGTRSRFMEKRIKCFGLLWKGVGVRVGGWGWDSDKSKMDQCPLFCPLTMTTN